MSLQPTGFRGPSLTPTATSKNKTSSTASYSGLSDDELRKRIFANAAVLFPSGSTQHSAYEIVYGMQARQDTSLRYAMLVRSSPSGEFAPLLRGLASPSAGAVLQGLLDSTSAAIHKRLGSSQLPTLGVSEQLPSYSPRLTVNQ